MMRVRVDRGGLMRWWWWWWCLDECLIWLGVWCFFAWIEGDDDWHGGMIGDIGSFLWYPMFLAYWWNIW